MTTTDHLRAEVARRFAALDMPSWPAPHAEDSAPAEEEYSRVSEPERYRIVIERARLWAQVLAEAGAVVVPEAVRSAPAFPWNPEEEPVQRALRVDPPAGVAGAAPWWLLESDVPQNDGGTLPVLRVAVGRPDQVREALPDCGCDACDPGSADLLDAVDEAVLGAVSAGVTLTGRCGLLRRRDWHVVWDASGRAEGDAGPRWWPFRRLVRACEELASGGQPALPRGTRVSIRAAWFPGRSVGASQA
ncbi:DUF6226 family protein [Micrococcus sp.]|uniref:DUF6226 family protein n=1 Tax=Micrococcus sp. TaxID=1271 RepID=UPI002A9102E7|nr:DUF6226 family protein [Micrococcus sp.]MDY6054530.1 DUF6226 family protein [Micrococcus sp.]